MNDQLREAAEDVVAWFSRRTVGGWAEKESGLRINNLREALSATQPDAQVEDAPGGPLVEAAIDMVGLADMDRIPAPNACVWFNAFDRRVAKLRDALNRLKGDER